MGQCRERRDDEKRAPDALSPPDVVEHRDGLGRLAQAHLVSENHGAMIVPVKGSKEAVNGSKGDCETV